jgi:DNA invertase Pin-like site-specific DNA recombinase
MIKQPRKLSQHHAEKIRELNNEGIGQKKLAEQFGVSRTAIKAILQNKTYKSCKH